MNCFFRFYLIWRGAAKLRWGGTISYLGFFRQFPASEKIYLSVTPGTWASQVRITNRNFFFWGGGGWKRKSEVLMGLLRSQKRRRAARTKPTSLEILHCVLTYNPTGCWALSNTCCGTWCLIRQSWPSPPVCSRLWSDCPEPASTPNVLGLVISWAKTVRSLTT
jgi:hypothetical protein